MARNLWVASHGHSGRRARTPFVGPAGEPPVPTVRVSAARFDVMLPHHSEPVVDLRSCGRVSNSCRPTGRPISGLSRATLPFCVHPSIWLNRTADRYIRNVAAAEVLHKMQRINLFGIGPTAALARYAAPLLARTGRRARVLDATGLALADQMLDLRVGDGLLMMAYTQPYRAVTALVREAKRLSLPAVLIADSANHRLAALGGADPPGAKRKG